VQLQNELAFAAQNSIAAVVIVQDLCQMLVYICKQPLESQSRLNACVRAIYCRRESERVQAVPNPAAA
jgi:hypothetical protein